MIEARGGQRGTCGRVVGERLPNVSMNLLVALINLNKTGKLFLSPRTLRSRRLPDLSSLLS